MRNTTTAVALVLASLCHAAPPASRPAEVDALRQQIVRLEAELAAARAENAKLKATTQPASSVADALKNKKIVNGMTLTQAEGMMGKATFQSQDENGDAIYTWDIGPGVNYINDRELTEGYHVIGRFRNEKLLSWRATTGTGGSAVEARPGTFR